MKIFQKYFVLFLILFTAILPAKNANACACGCGVLNVATSSILPNSEGGMVFLQYDDLDQKRNWHGENRTNGHNHDQRITTQTYTLGGQYMFNRDWGAAIRVPTVNRYVENLPHSGNLTYTNHTALGDIRINGIYSGFFDNMSTGITFGVKLPTGRMDADTLERNQQIGTGSTDWILGAYHMGNFGDSDTGYFMQANWERAFMTHRGYTPGQEISVATGVYHDLGKFGVIDRIAPVLQIAGSKKNKDSGWADFSHNRHSGYHMAFIAPGIEISFKQFKLYADVEMPIYRQVNGNQLVPHNLYKMILSYNF